MLIRILKFLYTVYTAIVFVVLLIITLPFFFIFSWIFRNNALPFAMALCRFIAYALMFLCGIIYRFHRNKKADRKQTYVIVANHKSNIDAPVAAVAYRGNIRYLAKKELLKVPLLGQLFSVTTVNVDRSSPESRKKSIDKLKQDLAKGDHIFLFPEGTRNKTENEVMISFKDGAFLIAVQTQTPILPMIFYNTEKLMPHNSLLMQPGVVDIYHLDPVSVQGLTEADVPALKKKVREMMIEKYIEVAGLKG